MERDKINRSEIIRSLGFLLEKWEKGMASVSEEEEIFSLSHLLGESDGRYLDSDADESLLKLFLDLRRIGESSFNNEENQVTDEELEHLFDREIKSLASINVEGSNRRQGKLWLRISVAAAVVALLLGGYALFISDAGIEVGEIKEDRLAEAEGGKVLPQDTVNLYLSSEITYTEENNRSAGKRERRERTTIENRGGLGVIQVEKDSIYKGSEEELRSLLANVNEDLRGSLPIGGRESDGEDLFKEVRDFDLAMNNEDITLQPEEILGGVVQDMSDDIASIFGEINELFDFLSENMEGGKVDEENNKQELEE